MISLIRNREIKRWKNLGKWSFVYGRRKTGKTYFVRNFTDWDRYYFIGRSGEIFEGNEKISYETFLREVFRTLETNEKVVIDEIQRLPNEFYDRLHKEGVKGNLTAISSTLWLGKNLIGKKSPLLGLFSEFKLGLIDEIDVLKNLLKKIEDPKKLVEFSVYLREPWLVPLWESSENFLLTMASNTKITIPALIGEIFTEEEKELSTVYEGVLKAISDGKRVSGKITNYLYSLKVISAQNPSLVHPYLDSLHKIGLLEKMKVHGRNKYRYYHTSPVMDLYYYLTEKYGFSERDLPEPQIEKVLNEKIPHHVEQFFRNLLSRIFGYGREVILEKDYEIDIVLTDFQKIKVVAEVKWKKEVSNSEIRRIEEVLNKFSCKKILLVPNKNILESKPRDVEVWDVKDILNKLE